MKIIRNIPSVTKILFSLPGLTILGRKIDSARKEGNVEEEQEYILGATSKWGKWLVRKFKINLTLYNMEKLPENGPVVYVCNHQGYADIPVLCAVLDKFQFGFIAKDNLKQIPLYGQWMRRIRSVMIKRDDPRAALQAISQGVDFINQGFSMVIFPEGTRSQTGLMTPFKKGSLKLATKPGVPLVPLSINGSRDVFENTGVFGKADISLIVHDPIPTKGLTREEEKALNDRIFSIVDSGLENLKSGDTQCLKASTPSLMTSLHVS